VCSHAQPGRPTRGAPPAEHRQAAPLTIAADMVTTAVEEEAIVVTKTETETTDTTGITDSGMIGMIEMSSPHAETRRPRDASTRPRAYRRRGTTHADTTTPPRTGTTNRRRRRSHPGGLRRGSASTTCSGRTAPSDTAAISTTMTTTIKIPTTRDTTIRVAAAVSGRSVAMGLIGSEEAASAAGIESARSGWSDARSSTARRGSIGATTTTATATTGTRQSGTLWSIPLAT